MINDIENEKFFTIEEVAKMFGISIATVYNLMNRQEIPSLMIGSSRRIPKSLLLEVINSNLTLAK